MQLRVRNLEAFSSGYHTRFSLGIMRRVESGRIERGGSVEDDVRSSGIS